MIVNFSLDISITAKPIDNHYGLDMSKKYPVKDLMMGQSSTSLQLEDITDRGIYNSIHFEFYIGEKGVDIYNSGLFNHYRTRTLPGIKYI